jgi:hypothetical protein
MQLLFVMNSYLFVSESVILIIVRITTEMIKLFSIAVITFLFYDSAAEDWAECLILGSQQHSYHDNMACMIDAEMRSKCWESLPS